MRNRVIIEISCEEDQTTIEIRNPDPVELGEQTYPILTRKSDLIADALSDILSELVKMSKKDLMKASIKRLEV